MRAWLLIAFFAAANVALAGDEFNRIVKAIESQYGVKQTHIPFLGVANLAVKVAHKAGTSEFKLAVFENLDESPAYRDHAALDRLMYGLSSHELRPLVRVQSRRSGESTYIYVTESGRSTRMLIAAFQPSHATVVQVKMDLATLLSTLEEPERSAQSLAVTDDQ